MAATWWMVLNHAQDRIVYKSRSCLEAFRVARRGAGASARLERDDQFGVAVIGPTRTLTVVPVGMPARLADSFRIAVEGGSRVAIPIESGRVPEVVPLPGGGSFTWIPAGTLSPAASPVLSEHR